MENAKIEMRDPSTINELENNPRTITRKDLDRLVKSIQDNQDYFRARPIILSDRTGELVVIAGNQRLRASKILGLKEVPTYLIKGLTEEREKEIIIRDNVANGEWDMDKLANEWDIEKLDEWGVDVPKIVEVKEDKPVDIDEDGEPESKVGEIYHLGLNKLYCGSFNDDKVKTMFDGRKATAVFTDPPYNVDYHGHNNMSIKNDAFASDDEFTDFLTTAVGAMTEYSVKGAPMIIWMSSSEFPALFKALEANDRKVKSVITWVKNTFTLGRSDFQQQNEAAVYSFEEGKYNKDEAEANDGTDDAELAIYSREGGTFTKNRKVSTAWFFPKPTANKYHPTMKPVRLCAKGVLAIAQAGEIVFDPFLGSGSTIIASEQTGRYCYGCELDPKYADAIRKRYWTLATGAEDGWQEGTK